MGADDDGATAGVVVADAGAVDVADVAAEPPFDPHAVNDNNAQAAPAANNVLIQRIQADPPRLLVARAG
ncbi:hypothetical protein ACFWAY_44320 [Rhodococcus sp. NPDC059968]|uniref:hypothetical protein n=1 Tax=Rhodococcus sp. NPDC059968 TaxID=3347017 RepID=UPI00366E2E4E